jgi:hypothetical protein
MRRLVPILLMSLPLAACASGGWRHTAAKTSIDAVVQDESQRAKAAQAAQSGATATDALGRVSDGPKDEKAGP